MARTLSITASFQVPAGVALALWLHRDHGLSLPLAALASLGAHLAAGMIFVHRLLHWVDDHRSPWWRTWLLEVPYSAYATSCFVAAPFGYLAMLASVVLRALGRPGPDLLDLLVPALCFGGVLGLWGTTLGRVIPVVRTVTVPVKSLPAAFEGLRVVQLSDLHLGPYVPLWMHRYWARVALRQRPDVIALTGDFITTGEGYLDEVEAFARSLSAPLGVFACMGNHDYFQTDEGVVEALRRGGVKLLRNEGELLSRAEASLWFAGVDDRWSQRDDLEAALRGAPEGVPRVWLSHDPLGFTAALARGVELTLAGHTHGGQFGLPWPFERANLARLIGRYTAGLYVRGDCSLYVHRGNGITGVPTRIGMWPEVAVLVLSRATSSSR